MKSCCGSTCFLTCGCGCLLPLLLTLAFIGLGITALFCPGCIQIY